MIAHFQSIYKLFHRNKYHSIIFCSQSLQQQTQFQDQTLQQSWNRSKTGLVFLEIRLGRGSGGLIFLITISGAVRSQHGHPLGYLTLLHCALLTAGLCMNSKGQQQKFFQSGREKHIDNESGFPEKLLKHPKTVIKLTQTYKENANIEIQSHLDSWSLSLLSSPPMFWPTYKEALTLSLGD